MRWKPLLAVSIAALLAGAALGCSGGGGGDQAKLLSDYQLLDVHSLAFSALDPSVVFFGSHGGLMRSEDGGRNWSLTDIDEVDAMNIATHSSAPGLLFIAGHEVFLRSTDGGLNWEPMRGNLPGLDIHALALDPGDAQHLYAYVANEGIFESRDGGEHWSLLNSDLPISTLALVALAWEPDTLVLGSLAKGVLRSTDGGRSWTPSNEGLGGETVTSLAQRLTDGVLFAGTTEGVYRSSDAGHTWSRTELAADVGAIAVSPHEPALVLAVDWDGRLHESHDGGLTWAPLRGDMPEQEVRLAAAAQSDTWHLVQGMMRDMMYRHAGWPVNQRISIPQNA